MDRRLPLAPIALALSAFAAPAFADDHGDVDQEIIADVEAFFAAQNTGEKARMRQHMIPEAKFSIRRIGDVEGKRSEELTTKRYIKRIASWGDRTEERMTYTSIEVSGDKATVVGPFVFLIDGEVSHCGVNSLGMVKDGGVWKLGDSSYEIVPPKDCAAVGAPPVGG